MATSRAPKLTLTLTLMLCVGASASLPSDPHGRRIFVDLCSSGLGPVQCGTLFPAQASEARASTASTTSGGPLHGSPRRSLCPDLCANALGFPLCRCPTTSSAVAVNWTSVSVCGIFCRLEGLTVYGCPTCTLKPQVLPQGVEDDGDGDIDWDLWCHEQCLIGDGGLACNCDLIP